MMDRLMNGWSQMNKCIYIHIILLQVSAVQISVNEFVCQSHLSGTILTVSTDLMISGVTVTKEYVAVWDGRTINVYSIMFEKGQVKQTGKIVLR